MDEISIKVMFEYLIKNNLIANFGTILDVGAGIGRFFPLFSNYFDKIDAIEPFPKFNAHLHFLKESNENSKIRNLYN